MTESEIIDVENELGDLPAAFRSFLLSLPASFDEELAFQIGVNHGHVYLSPQALLQANLALIDADSWLADTEWSELELEDYLVIGGDGCGNYYIVDPDDDESPVQLLSHDPVGIADGYESVQDYCNSVRRTIDGLD